MKKRIKMSKKGSAKHFTRNALKVHKKNAIPTTGGPMRGGIRL